MATKLTIKEVAAKYGKQPGTVRAAAKRLGLGLNRTGREVLLTEAQAAKVAAAIRPGRGRPKGEAAVGVAL